MSTSKIIIAVVVVAVIALLLLSANKSAPSTTPSGNEPVTTGSNTPATGSIEPTVNSMLTASANEQSVIEQENGYETTSEVQALNEFGQSYNENEL